MTAMRVHLLVLIVAVAVIGLAVGLGQWPLAIPLVPAAAVALWPLWRLGGYRIAVLLSPPGRRQERL